MKKYLFLFKYEMKTIIRAPLNLYMLSFPFIILILSSLVFPLIFQSIDGQVLEVTMLILVLVILIFANFFLAAMATFLLLEQKDENTFNTLAVTPLGITGYLKFKLTYIYVMSLFCNLIVVYGTKLLAGDKYVIGNINLLDNISFGKIFTFSLVNGLFVLSLTLIQASLAKNKVEGFAFIKGTGILAILPMLIVLDTFQGSLQYLLGIFPNFWHIKGIIQVIFPISSKANLSYPMYIIIGILYNIILLLSSYYLFNKKVQY